MMMILLPAMASLLAVRWIYFKMLRIAKAKGLVDNPEARKLQAVPVPVVGGLTMFFGVLVGMMVAFASWSLNEGGVCHGLLITERVTVILPLILGLSVMLYAGCLDDVLGLSPKTRFAVEILVILGMTLSTGVCVDSLHGLWGVGEFSWRVAMPLTVFAGVGVINAINMMDGVNGLSSGICIVCCLLCGMHFFLQGDWGLASLAFCTAVSLSVFFVHNVFGGTSRMFIGDAGTMCLGLMMSWFVFCIMHSGTFAYDGAYQICPTAMVVALFSVPVADTLRVMTQRMVGGRSPFSPDKMHLHHAFVDLGFSHAATTLCEVVIGLTVVSAWVISLLLGASMEMQLYVVIGVAALLVWAMYFFLRHEATSHSRIAHSLRSLAQSTHWEESRWWQRLGRCLDNR